MLILIYSYYRNLNKFCNVKKSNNYVNKVHRLYRKILQIHKLCRKYINLLIVFSLFSTYSEINHKANLNKLKNNSLILPKKHQ
jgi:hypothetical protein